MRPIRAPESSQASRVSARRLPMATPSSRSVMPWAPRSPMVAVTMARASATCSGAVPSPMLIIPASQKATRSDHTE